MDSNPVCPLCGPYEAVRRLSWQEDPVSLFQGEPFAVNLKFGSTPKQYDPLIMVLGIVDRPIDHTAEKKSSTGRRAHRLKATPGIADLSLLGTTTARAITHGPSPSSPNVILHGTPAGAIQIQAFV